MILKIATYKDKKFIWILRNQNSTLKWFPKIKLDDHINWFKKEVANERNIFYIATLRKKKIGYIRYSLLKNKHPTISYFIKENFQNLGYGTEILIEGSIKIFKEKKDIKKLIAHVDKNNISSIKCFKKAGFNNIKHDFKFVYFELNRRNLKSKKNYD